MHIYPQLIYAIIYRRESCIDYIIWKVSLTELYHQLTKYISSTYFTSKYDHLQKLTHHFSPFLNFKVPVVACCDLKFCLLKAIWYMYISILIGDVQKCQSLNIRPCEMCEKDSLFNKIKSQILCYNTHRNINENVIDFTNLV